MKKAILVFALAAVVASAQAQSLQSRSCESTESNQGYGPESFRKKGDTCIAIDASYSYRTAKGAALPVGSTINPTKWSDFIRRFRSGVTIGASAAFFFNDVCGIGPEITYSRYASSLENVDFAANAFYFAPKVVGRFRQRNGEWILAASSGVIYYHQRASRRAFLSSDITSAFGFKAAIEAGYDFRLGRRMFFGPKIALTLGGVSPEDSGEVESIGAVEIGGGLRF